jgi:hypothetical protein
MTNPEHWKHEVLAALAGQEPPAVAAPPTLASIVRRSATRRLIARQRQQIALVALALATLIAFTLTRWANAERAQTDAITLVTPGVLWIP